MAGLIDRVFRRIGRTYIENQNQVNAGHQEQLDMLRGRCEALESRCEEQEKQLKLLKANEQLLHELYQYMQARQTINPGLEENIRNNNYRLDSLEERTDGMEIKLKAASKQVVVSSLESGTSEVTVLPKSEDEYSCIDYYDFENHFRGSREAIKKVQEQYIGYFTGRKNVLDLGCGRGEFLELLRDHDIDATGVECYTEFAEYCKMKQLNVVEDDALAYLEKQETVGGIFAGQLIEHLKFNQIVKLCELAYEKLEEGAYMILETPNPMSLAIYTHAFYMDPSHNKPIHPLTMEYFMRKVGFKNVEILFTESSKYPVEIPELAGNNIENIDAFNQSMKEVSKALFGSQDYAIIARR